jgi:hypothetical protein
VVVEDETALEVEVGLESLLDTIREKNQAGRVFLKKLQSLK